MPEKGPKKITFLIYKMLRRQRS